MSSPAAVELVVEIKAAGDVSDFDDPGKRVTILQVIADAAGLSTDGAYLNITSASVIIIAVFPVENAAAANAASTSISTAMSTPVSASLLFTSAGVAVSVESTPSVLVVAIISPSPPPLPPPPSAPSPQLPTSDEEFLIIIVAAAAGGGGAILIGLGLGTLYWYFRRKRQRARNAEAANNKAEAEKMEVELGNVLDAPSASPRKEAPPSERTLGRAALRVQKVARGKEERKSFEERKTQAAPNLVQNTALSNLTTEELATASARKRKTEELAAERKRKMEEKRKREAEERRRRAEEAERLRIKLETQARNRIVEERRLYGEAVAATERRMLEKASACIIETEARRFLAKKRLQHAYKYRVLRRPDHIDVAIMHGRGRDKLTQLIQAKRKMEEFIRANAAKVAAKKGKEYTPPSPALNSALGAAKAKDEDATPALRAHIKVETRADSLELRLELKVIPPDAPMDEELTA